MATLLLRGPACPLLCHCPCVGPSVAQTLHLAALAGSTGGFLSPPCPLPAVLSC